MTMFEFEKLMLLGGTYSQQIFLIVVFQELECIARVLVLHLIGIFEQKRVQLYIWLIRHC